MTDAGSAFWRTVTPTVTPTITPTTTAFIKATNPGSGVQTSAVLPKTIATSAGTERVGRKGVLGLLGLMIGIGLLI